MNSPTDKNNSLPMWAIKIIAIGALLISLGALYFSINNRLETNRLTLLPAQIPSLMKHAILNQSQLIKTSLASQQKRIDALNQKLKQNAIPMNQALTHSLIAIAKDSWANHTDPALTLSLLRLAQNISPKENKTPLNQSIQHDIDTLSKINTQSKTQSIKALSDLEKQCQKLKQQKSDNPEKAKTHQKWYQKFKHNLKSLFVIRHNASLISLSIPTWQSLRIQIDTQIAIAQWAVLYNQQNVFERSLQSITTLVNETPEGPVRQRINKALNGLKSIKLPSSKTVRLLSFSSQPAGDPS